LRVIRKIMVLRFHS